MTNSESGFSYAMANLEQLEVDRQYYFDLFNEQKDSIEIMRKRWGILDFIGVKAFSNKQSHQKAAFIGVKPTFISSSALYLADLQRPLMLAGNAIVNGNCYLPKAGVKIAYINNTGYSRNVLVDGEIQDSQSFLPELKVKDPSDILLSDAANNILSVDNDTIENSFLNPLLTIVSNDPLHIQNLVKGYVIVHSLTEIVVHRDAQLENALLIAPYIIFESGFKGQCQAFASDSIIVENDVKLKFPTVLYVGGSDRIKDNDVFSKILLKDGCSVEGAIIGAQEKATIPLVHISKNAVATGQVYVNGYFQHEGVLIGNVICKKLYLKLPSATYENHLFNAVIDFKKLSDNYVGFDLFQSPASKGVLKWID